MLRASIRLLEDSANLLTDSVNLSNGLFLMSENDLNISIIVDAFSISIALTISTVFLNGTSALFNTSDFFQDLARLVIPFLIFSVEVSKYIALESFIKPFGSLLLISAISVNRLLICVIAPLMLENAFDESYSSQGSRAPFTEYIVDVAWRMFEIFDITLPPSEILTAASAKLEATSNGALMMFPTFWKNFCALLTDSPSTFSTLSI